MTAVLKLLRANPVFQPLSEAGQETFASLARSQEYMKGEYLCHYGDDWPYLFLIAHGQIDAIKESVEGRSLLVASFHAHDIFWGMAFFDDALLMPVSLSAHKASHIYLWNRDSCLPFLLQHGALAWELSRLMAELADAAALEAEFAAKSALVAEALTNDVDWGIFLNDLARMLPERVWVESFNGSIAEGSVGEIVGQVTFSGVGFDYPDIAEWLRSLGSEGFKGVTGPWVSTASESSIGDEAVVSFSSSAALTTGAVTDRSQELIPEVP